MRYKNIKEIFEAYAEVKIDRKLALKVFEFTDHFMNKSDNHINFFSGNLWAVYPIRFLKTDEESWFENILGLYDSGQATDDLHALPEINPGWKVTGSLFNQSCVWLAHKFYTSKLPTKEKELGVIYCFVMMLAAHLCSLQTHRFKHPGQEDIAMAVYESLTKKTDLKFYGSWRDLIIARASIAVESKFVHREALTHLDTHKTMSLLADIVSRETKMVNLMTGKYHKFREEKTRIQSNSALIITDEGTTLKDYSNSVTKIKRDMASVMVDPADLIKQELIEATLNITVTANQRYLEEVLAYATNNYRGDKRLQELVEVLVVYLVDMAKSNKIDIGNVPLVVERLVNSIRSSRVLNKDVIMLRELAMDITTDAISNNRRVVVTATQIAFLVYLTIRTLTLGRYN